MIPKIALIANEKSIVKRSEILAQGVAAGLTNFDSVEQFESGGTAEQHAIIIIHSVTAKDDKDIAGQVQVAKYGSPNAYLMVIADAKKGGTLTAFIKKSGADSVLLEDEFYNTTKPEFLCAQKLHGQFVPVKTSELVPNKPVEMNIYHLMPLNRKLVKIMAPGEVLDSKKLDRINTIGEFYISRNEVNAFQRYIEKYQDRSAAGLLSRCRATHLYLTVTYKNLVQLLTDQSETASYKEGKELSDLCYTLASDLIMSLSSAGDTWAVINNAAFDDMTAIDRVPAIASVAGIFSLLTGIGQPNDVMVAALLADIGLLELPPRGLHALRAEGPKGLKEEDYKTYTNHPKLSINQVLSRKIPLTDKMKEIIMCTHERTDQKGFPNQPTPRKIPQESMLIQFAEKLDSKAKLEFGKARQDVAQVRKQVFKEEMLTASCFSFDFLEKIKPECS